MATKPRYLTFVCISVVAVLFLAAPLHAQARANLPTRLRAPVGAEAIGLLPGSQRMSLALTLPLRNQAKLQSLLQQLYDPNSPSYRKFLTVQQFTQEFGPTPADYEKAIAFAQSYNLAVTNATANRLVVDVNGAVSDIDEAFQVRMQVYQHPTENRTFYAPDAEPTVPVGVPVQGISGLSNFEPPHPMDLRTVQNETTQSNQTGSGPGGQFLGSDIRAAYAPGVRLTGRGQAVGLFESCSDPQPDNCGAYNLSDVQAYFSSVNQPLNVPIVNELLDGVNGICAGCDDGEETLDIEGAIPMAPGLSAVIVYEGKNDTDIFNQMATDDIAKQLSCSWGWSPADPSSDEPIFEEFAAQGQSLFVASGDGGAYTPPSCTSNCNTMNYPTDDPYITSVGGTDLTTDGPGGAWQSEVAWVGSGGGYSGNGFTIPRYQQPVINSSNQGSTTLRNVPDVAAEANTDNYLCYNGLCNGGHGGTSLSAPRWAGFLALANEQGNGVPIGLLNPIIYGIGQSASYDNDFHDITSGNNFNSESPDLFSAVPGYDLVTGWGTPNGQDLLSAFGRIYAGPNFELRPSPSTLLITPGGTRGSEIRVRAVNGFSSGVSLTATVLGQPAGVTAILTPPSVTGSGRSTLSISTTDSTPAGSFLIVVTGAGSGLSHAAYVTLETTRHRRS
jgi:subtilase family serine protease